MLSENSVKVILIITFLLFAYFLIGDYTPCHIKYKKMHHANGFNIPYIETTGEQIIYQE